MNTFVNRLPRRLTVMQWQRVVQYRDGEFRAVLNPGVHTVSRRRDNLFTVDMRAQLLQLPGQDLLTADGQTVKVSSVIDWHVSDPAVYAADTSTAYQRLYLDAQLLLRDAVAGCTLDEVLERRGGVLGTDAGVLAASLSELGITATRFVVKDIMLSGELRRALTEPLLAREAGKAQLERARAEAAVMRSMANTARLLRENPELLRLRTLESVAAGKAMVVLNG